MQKTKIGLLLLLSALGLAGGAGSSPLQSVNAQLAAGLVETIDYSLSHSFIRTKNGEIYTVGNSSKQAMLTPTNRYDTPFNVSTTNSLAFLSGQTIDKIAVGYDTTVILTTTGNVFTSGGNSEGQWGQGTTETYGRARPENMTSNFNTLTNTDRIVDIYASSTLPVVNMARSLEGRIYVWGANPHAEDTSYYSTTFTGKSGSGLTNTTSIVTPLDMTDLFLGLGEASITDIRLTAQGGIALTNDQFLYTWGLNKDGMLGIGNPDPSFLSATPTKVDLSSILESEETIVDISTSSMFISGNIVNHVVLTTSLGTLITWGINSYGLIDQADLIGEAKFVGSPTIVDTSEIVLEAEEMIIQALSLDGIYLLTNLGRVFTRGSTALVSLANFMPYSEIAQYLLDPYFIDQTMEFPILPEGDFIKVLYGMERSFAALSDQGRVMTARGDLSYVNSFNFSNAGSAAYLHGLSEGLRYYIFIGESNTPYADYAVGDTFTLPKQTAPEGYYHDGWSYNPEGPSFGSSFSSVESRINYEFTFSGNSHNRIYPVFVEGVDPTSSSSSEVSSSISSSTSLPGSTSQPTTSEPGSSQTPVAPRGVNPAVVIVTTAAVAGVATFSYFFFLRGLTIGGFSFIAMKAWFALLLKRKNKKDDEKKK
jgi:alpha-tubulin suppressor-like RCC1 family protein